MWANKWMGSQEIDVKASIFLIQINVYNQLNQADIIGGF